MFKLNGEGALFDGTGDSAHTVKTFLPHENVSRPVLIDDDFIIHAMLWSNILYYTRFYTMHVIIANRYKGYKGMFCRE